MQMPCSVFTLANAAGGEQDYARGHVGDPAAPDLCGRLDLVMAHWTDHE